MIALYRVHAVMISVAVLFCAGLSAVLGTYLFRFIRDKGRSSGS